MPVDMKWYCFPPNLLCYRKSVPEQVNHFLKRAVAALNVFSYYMRLLISFELLSKQSKAIYMEILSGFRTALIYAVERRFCFNARVPFGSYQ